MEEVIVTLCLFVFSRGRLCLGVAVVFDVRVTWENKEEVSEIPI
jgi:hypothetical protein